MTIQNSTMATTKAVPLPLAAIHSSVSILSLSPVTPARAPSIPVWSLTKHRAKLTAATWALQGRSYEFTLNLSPAVERKARASKNGFTDFMRERLKRYLKEKLGAVPDFLFGVGITAHGRLHIHGMIVCDPSTHKATGDALKAAGGAWGKKAGRQHQLDLRAPERPPAGWIDYLMRNMGTARKHVHGSGYAMTQNLNRKARAAYEDKRQRVVTAKISFCLSESKSATSRAPLKQGTENEERLSAI